MFLITTGQKRRHMKEVLEAFSQEIKDRSDYYDDTFLYYNFDEIITMKPQSRELQDFKHLLLGYHMDGTNISGDWFKDGEPRLGKRDPERIKETIRSDARFVSQRLHDFFYANVDLDIYDHYGVDEDLFLRRLNWISSRAAFADFIFENYPDYPTFVWSNMRYYANADITMDDPRFKDFIEVIKKVSREFREYYRLKYDIDTGQDIDAISSQILGKPNPNHTT